MFRANFENIKTNIATIVKSIFISILTAATLFKILVRHYFSTTMYHGGGGQGGKHLPPPVHPLLPPVPFLNCLPPFFY